MDDGCLDTLTRDVTTTTTMATRRPLSDAENLAVGAFGGIVETCVQSACASIRDRWMRPTGARRLMMMMHGYG